MISKIFTINSSDVVKGFRPTEVEQLLGNPAKAVRELGWNPQQTTFEQLVQKMVDHDLKAVAHAHR